MLCLLLATEASCILMLLGGNCFFLSLKTQSGHAGPRPPGSGVPLAAALHQLRPALAPDSPGLAQLRLHASRHRPDGQCTSEGTGEGISELEVGALPRGDSAEVEMQSDALDAARG